MDPKDAAPNGRVQLVSALINAGGLGVLAMVMVWLHINNLAQCREERHEIVSEFRQEAALRRQEFERRTEQLMNEIRRLVGKKE